ncbi:MAG TPA: hypothetical protein VKR59_13115 [Terriglobales bacterium]|nr:hypothetical protein [Terriglobales bacterium]
MKNKPVTKAKPPGKAATTTTSARTPLQPGTFLDAKMRVWKLDLWKIDSIKFRDAVRSGDESALERLEHEADVALCRLGDKFGVEIGATDWLLDDGLEHIKEILMDGIEELADSDSIEERGGAA